MTNEHNIQKLNQLNSLANIASPGFDFKDILLPPEGRIARLKNNSIFPHSSLTIMSRPSPNTVIAAEQNAQTNSPRQWYDEVLKTEVFLGEYQSFLKYLTFWATYDSNNSEQCFHIVNESLCRPFRREVDMSSLNHLIAQLSVATIISLTDIPYLEVEQMQSIKSYHLHKSGHISQIAHL